MSPRPLCFMIMPYGRRPTQVEAGHGPAEIDFNALWDRAYAPVIEALGFKPVRADQDTGALIISQMLQRLYFADLVLADMTIPNGNVYYEVGIRHAAKPTGCVLLAATWAKPLFDVAQQRTVRYPLQEGEITPATAGAFRAAVQDEIKRRISGESPMLDALPGYPDPDAIDPQNASTMKDQMAALGDFQVKLGAIRAAPKSQRIQLAQQLIHEEGSPPATYQTARAMAALLRDSAENVDDWKIVLTFLRGLPDEFRLTPEMREQGAFVASQAGNTAESIAELDTLIKSSGPTPERLGMLGGRYKRQIDSESLSAGERKTALYQSIQAYERGMYLDLNEYYCSSNLPRLYRRRGEDGDEQRAQNIGHVVVAACERARRQGVTDPWLPQTLLGAAFDSGDIDKATQLTEEVVAEGPIAWQLKGTLADLKISVQYVKDDALRARFTAQIAKLESLLA
jgi:hypothetical protein